MMEIKKVKTDEQYQIYLERVHSLIEELPLPNTPESDELELLSVLIEDYEKDRFPIKAPSPIDAIKFRMAEQNLKQVDLVSYLGTPSRVSEVLSGRRPLTVEMIKRLSVGLGISTDTLIGVHEKQIDWSKFPIKEMISRNWIKSVTTKSFGKVEKIVEEFITSNGFDFSKVAFKRTLHGDVSVTTQSAIYAWLARVVQCARERQLSGEIGEFKEGMFSEKFFKELAQLSKHLDGPKRAIKFLENNGITVVFERHIKGTSIDGASLKDTNGRPIIGMTLRYDQLDSFWFTLLHEVAHIWKHVTVNDAFLDNNDSESDDKKEAEANRIAREAFIPRAVWRRSEAYMQPTKERINLFANQLNIHPAIVAGRIRYDKKNYSLFSDMVGRDTVREIFFKNNTKESEL